MKIEVDISSNDVNALKDAIKKSVKAEFKVSIRELKAKNFALRGAVAARDSQLSALRKQLSVLQNKENEFDNLLAMKEEIVSMRKGVKKMVSKMYVAFRDASDHWEELSY